MKPDHHKTLRDLFSKPTHKGFEFVQGKLDKDLFTHFRTIKRRPYRTLDESEKNSTTNHTTNKIR